ncbi:MAG TPA: hypothetical protein VG870_05175 [Chitinophagaceae bacterium]|nr:hypothetical protein [Chitinophagaceae bacterium]
MASYLLLRNNKQSGPYSLQALIEMGLKPYDLVWVEGRSAAWRYPSEIEDLKPYAPAVEEQPFDRFFKKPAETAEESRTAPSRASQPQAGETTLLETQATPPAQIYIALPAGKTPVRILPKEESGSLAATAQATPSQAPSYSELAREFSQSATAAEAGSKQAASAVPLPTPSLEAPLETNFSQSLDEIKDRYVQTLVDRKRRIAQRKTAARLIRQSLPFAAVLVLGMVLGRFVMNHGTKEPGQQQNIVTRSAGNRLPLPAPQTQQQSASLPVQPTTTDQESGQPAGQLPETAARKVTFQTPATQPGEPGDKTGRTARSGLGEQALKKQPRTPAAVTGSRNHSVQKPGRIEPDEQTGERTRQVRPPLEEGHMASVPSTAGKSVSLLTLVSVRTNDYKRGTFGGIHDLQLTVQNSSPYLLDQVSVELQYLKPSEQPLRSETVQFNSVPPGGSLTIAIPPSNRGIKVACKVIRVESRQYGSELAESK